MKRNCSAGWTHCWLTEMRQKPAPCQLIGRSDGCDSSPLQHGWTKWIPSGMAIGLGKAGVSHSSWIKCSANIATNNWDFHFLMAEMWFRVPFQVEYRVWCKPNTTNMCVYVNAKSRYCKCNVDTMGVRWEWRLLPRENHKELNKNITMRKRT